MAKSEQFPIVQVLNEKGEICEGQKDPRIKKEDLLNMYKVLVRVRVTDERMFKLQRQGRIAFYMSTYGEEATHIGAAYALKPQDWIFPQYREQGAAFMRGLPLQTYVNQLYGNCEDLMKGRQMPMHWGQKDLNLVTISSTLGTQIPQSVGTAYAMKIKKDDAVALSFFGEGTTSEGDFHAGANFAGVYKAPAILFCRNNGWAISTPIEKQTAAESIAIKSLAYGIHGVRVDGNDLFAIINVVQEARKRAINGEGATLVEALTYRLASHSTSDDPSVYRNADEDDAPWKQKEPKTRLSAYLKNKGWWSDAEEADWQKTCEDELLTAIKHAESLPKPETESMFEDIYDEVPWHLQEQKKQLFTFLNGEKR